MDSMTEKQRYFSQPVERITGTEDTPERSLFRLTESGVYFREHRISAGHPGDPVEIVQITDVHFNFCDDIDLKNPELAYTKECRKWLADGASVRGIRNAMGLAKFADQIVITGDTLDYLSHGAMEMTKRYIWDEEPSAILAIGGHELTRQMQTGRPNETTLESRYADLQREWKHDISYVSRVIRDRVMVIAMDNDCGRYRPEQLENLTSDLAEAREKGYVVLLFQHEPLDTGRPEDACCPTLWECDGASYNFRYCIGSPERNDSETAKAVYRLITSSADVIRGIYCGHLHSAYYTEVIAGDTVIPQYVLEGNPYNGQAGHVMRIFVE